MSGYDMRPDRASDRQSEVQRTWARPAPDASVVPRSRGRFVLVLVTCAALAAAAVVVGLLAGHQWLYTGDIVPWLRGEGLPLVRFALDERAPRVTAAVLAGGALALSGTLVQATCRDPLAEPGILGITGGAGLGAGHREDLAASLPLEELRQVLLSPGLDDLRLVPGVGHGPMDLVAVVVLATVRAPADVQLHDVGLLGLGPANC